MHLPSAIPECLVDRIVAQNRYHLVIQMRQGGTSGRCPDCGLASRSVHSRYHRHPADLPLSASRTTLRIIVRRFYCFNLSCQRCTFAEPPSELLKPRARRTRRLADAQGRVGIACGGAGGARLLKHLRMPASPATVLRLVRAMPMPDAPSPVGVDDWAISKGCRYGTIVVDLDRPAAGTSLPSARQLARLLVQPTAVLDAAATAAVAHVEQDEAAKAVADLARRFTALVRAAGVRRTAPRGGDSDTDFDSSITQAKACEAPAIATFALGLDGDAAAVRAALTEPWSNGQAEGRINRLKLLKRQCYGRAGRDLLQRRMVLAA